MTAPDHERWGDSVAAWVLGALPEDDRAQFEAHLASCSICRDEAAELKAAAAVLPTMVPEVAPPPALRDRLVSVVRAEAQLLAVAGPGADRPHPAPARSRKRRGWFWRAVPAPLVAAALALGVLAGVLGGDALHDGAGVRTTTAQLAPRIAGQATARLELTGKRARLIGDHLPAPPAGRIYQVWLKRAGEADPEPTAALFTVTRDGRAAVDVPGRLDGVERVMVTDEPAGGSQHPTGELLLTAVPA